MSKQIQDKEKNNFKLFDVLYIDSKENSVICSNYKEISWKPIE